MSKSVSPESVTDVVASGEHGRRLGRRFSAEDRRRLPAEAETYTERGRLAELLRRERLFSSQLAAWRARLQREGQSGNRSQAARAQAAQGRQGPA